MKIVTRGLYYSPKEDDLWEYLGFAGAWGHMFVNPGAGAMLIHDDKTPENELLVYIGEI